MSILVEFVKYALKSHLHQVIAGIAEQFLQADLAYGHGTADAHDEACWLVAHALGMDVAADIPDMLLDKGQCQRIKGLVSRRLRERQPLAYLLGEAWFCGLPFSVNAHTLVPRSPLAELISAQFHPWINSAKKHWLLDIGTGCGCIAIACAVNMSWLQVTGTDIDSQALQLAAVNARRHGVDQRCQWLQADIFAGINSRFDIIVSNPPYVPAGRQGRLPREYQHEPGQALFSGSDGLQHAAEILLAAPAHLQPGGVLVLELGETAEVLQQQLPMLPLVWPELQAGGEGVIIADAGMLAEHDRAIKNWYQQRTVTKYVQ